jgi:hypothetical protein
MIAFEIHARRWGDCVKAFCRIQVARILQFAATSSALLPKASPHGNMRDVNLARSV